MSSAVVSGIDHSSSSWNKITNFKKLINLVLLLFLFSEESISVPECTPARCYRKINMGKNSIGN